MDLTAGTLLAPFAVYLQTDHISVELDVYSPRNVIVP